MKPMRISNKAGANKGLPKVTNFYEPLTDAYKPAYYASLYLGQHGKQEDYHKRVNRCFQGMLKK